MLITSRVCKFFLDAIYPAHAPGTLMPLDDETVLLRGVFSGLRRRAGMLCGSLQVDWVYNSMPPVPGQIYPPLELLPMQEF